MSESAKYDYLLVVSTDSEKEAVRRVAEEMTIPVSNVAGKLVDFIHVGADDGIRVAVARSGMGARDSSGSGTTTALARIEDR